MLSFLPILFALALSALLICQNAQGELAEITLLHTNNVTGHLFPCPS
jgi:2',3'-cyclic-nucleotide 2'-phosphodiesterase (5'-nucleotidase family)